uniref:NADH-ubiquinone oxidoreductase chain 5 n=1 Tax=Balbiania investiens TaxID=111861 RepID=A0A4D6BM09_9FLOR
MYLLIVMLPLFGAIISGLGGRWIGRYGSCLLSTTCVILSFLLSVLAFYEIGFGGAPCYITLITWMESGTFKVSWGFLFDSLTAVMLVVITTISSLVHIYSIKYMEEDPHVPRFMAYLEIFTFFMLILVTADNLVQMFLGWEGVGLASYLLINFWYTRLSANKAAIKALVTNKVGDFGLTLGILILFFIFQSVDYLTLFGCAPLMSSYYVTLYNIKIHGLTLASIFLFVGAMGKSAQLGLHMWLPDAMEGPTPVSALIHAATMVTAGVFLLVRFSPLIEYTTFTLFVLTIVGSLTTLFAAMTGVFQNDLKKVIAYSTCSQLGYMILACGLSCYDVSIFHLANHAFFKALLFLSAGSIIHAVSDEQDMRKMGSLVKFLPVTYSLMLIGSLTLIGFPFLTGFYSKDLIIELSQAAGYSNLYISYGSFACWLASTSVFFTSFYSFRLIYLTFINNSNVPRPILQHINENSFLMLFPLVLLTLGSIFIGYLTRDLFVGFGTDFWGSSIFILPIHTNIIEAEFLDTGIKWLPFFLSLSGIFLSSILNVFPYLIYYMLQYTKIPHFWGFLLSKKWYWDKIYNVLIISTLVNFGYSISFKAIDRGFVESLGPLGLTKLIPIWSRTTAKIQTGQLTHYIFFMISGLLIFLSFITPISILDLQFNPYLISICLLLLAFL